MPRRFVVVLAALAVGCDSGEDHFVSRFGPVPPSFNEVRGRVLRDTELVEGAIVKIDATTGQTPLGPLTGVTTAGYYAFPSAPQRYDLHVVEGLEVTTFRGVTLRYYEPLLAGTAPVRGFSGRVRVVLDPPPPAGHRVVFGASGSTDVLSLKGDADGGLDVSFRPYQLVKDPADALCKGGVMVHAIEIDARGTLAAPLAYGRTCVVALGAGSTAIANVKLAPIPQIEVPIVVNAAVPSGLAAGDVEVFVDFGLRYIPLPVATIANGASLSIVRIPDARYALRLRARGAAGASDTGIFSFEPNDRTIRPLLPPPLRMSGPIAGAQLGFESLSVDPAEAGGARELTLVPQSQGAPILHVIGPESLLRAPDLSALSLPPMRGVYTWSVRHWPTLANADAMTGTEARAASPSSESPSAAFTVP